MRRLEAFRAPWRHVTKGAKAAARRDMREQ